METTEAIGQVGKYPKIKGLVRYLKPACSRYGKAEMPQQIGQVGLESADEKEYLRADKKPPIEFPAPARNRIFHDVH